MSFFRVKMSICQIYDLSGFWCGCPFHCRFWVWLFLPVHWEWFVLFVVGNSVEMLCIFQEVASIQIFRLPLFDFSFLCPVWHWYPVCVLCCYWYQNRKILTGLFYFFPDNEYHLSFCISKDCKIRLLIGRLAVQKIRDSKKSVACFVVNFWYAFWASCLVENGRK